MRERPRLYTIVAADCAADKGAPRFTDDVRKQALHITNLGDTRHLPIALPLYIGMRRRLVSKD